MANREPVDMIIRRRLDGLTWPAIRLTVDLEDPDELLRHLETNARHIENKDRGTRWLPEYDATFTMLANRAVVVTVAGISKDDD